jgi:hypothetical protein
MFLKIIKRLSNQLYAEMVVVHLQNGLQQRLEPRKLVLFLSVSLVLDLSFDITIGWTLNAKINK